MLPSNVFSAFKVRYTSYLTDKQGFMVQRLMSFVFNVRNRLVAIHWSVKTKGFYCRSPHEDVDHHRG